MQLHELVCSSFLCLSISQEFRSACSELSSPVCPRVWSAADLVFPVPPLLASDLPEADLPPILGVAELLARVLVLHQLGANPDMRE